MLPCICALVVLWLPLTHGCGRNNRLREQSRLQEATRFLLFLRQSCFGIWLHCYEKVILHGKVTQRTEVFQSTPQHVLAWQQASGARQESSHVSVHPTQQPSAWKHTSNLECTPPGWAVTPQHWARSLQTPVLGPGTVRQLTAQSQTTRTHFWPHQGQDEQ